VIIITEISSVFWLHRGKQHDEFNLIFPWAEYDLHDYWRQVNPNPSPKEHQDNLSWLAEQCRVLRMALRIFIVTPQHLSGHCSISTLPS
jgi:hypothetical protein